MERLLVYPVEELSKIEKLAPCGAIIICGTIDSVATGCYFTYAAGKG
jgi:hypothetical protein